MRLHSLLSVVLTFSVAVAAHALPSAHAAVGSLHRLHQRRGGVDSQLRRDAGRLLSSLERRQSEIVDPSAPSSSGVPSSSKNSTVDPNIWDAQTASACERAIRALDGKTLSSSGIAVCYNLPFFDNSTGAFQADLRLYRVSPPQGDWVEISDKDITIGLSYSGASVSDNRDIGKRAENSASVNKRQASAPEMLQGINFVGQLNESYLTSPMNITQLVTLLAPNVTLTATGAGDRELSTTLSSKEASFVNGIFAGSPVGAASLTSIRPTPFVMPGTTLGIFPVGLIVTAVWTALGVGVVVWGTMGRYQFRQVYRKRKLREKMTATARM